MNTPKKIIVAVVSSLLIGKNSVHVAMAIEDQDIWMSKDHFKMFLFTLLMETTAHNLGTLLKGTGRKTCIINYLLETGNQICCTIIGFESKNELESAFCTEPIFGSMRLSWAKLGLVWCKRCRKFEHSALKCDAFNTLVSAPSKNFKRNAFDISHFQLARLYAKKNVPISHFAAFGGKSWAQVVSFFDSGFGFGSFSSGALGLGGSSSFVLTNNSSLISGIVCKISGIELVFLAFFPSSGHLVVLININLDLNSNMVLNDSVVVSVSSSVVPALGLNSSRILTTKVDCLKSKLVAFKASIGLVLISCVLAWNNVICWHKDKNNLVSIFMESKLREKVCLWIVNKFDNVQVFTFGLESGYLDASVVIVINSSLVRHVYRILEVPSWLLFIKLLFKNKFSVLILGLYTGASLAVQFSQAGDINSLIAKTVNKSFFIILGGDFNENGSHKCTNSRSVIKTIDYVLVFLNLINVIVHHNVLEVSEHFNMDYQSVSVSNNFKGAISANTAMFSNEFATFARFSDLDVIWDIIHKIIIISVNKVFKKKWFKGFDDIFTKESLSFYKLELLVSRIVKASCEKSGNVVDSSAGFDHIHSALFDARRSYYVAKLAESLRAKKINIESAINKKIKSFEVNKSHMIRSVLKHLFHKVVLDYLVVNDKLILESDLVKSKVDVIIEGWTRKCKVTDNISNNWCCQYQSLEYVFDEAFSGIMSLIEFNELFEVVSNLPDGKAAGLLDILNEL
ncbi:hypothetical protein G9A89_016974 [Geosiphon pyriformis]|nr:hypothetical protein G9A89_016974 [Geosiphon pyriformis]